VTLVINLGPVLLARLVSNAGAVYGSFATVAGMFALLYLVSQALVYSAEVAAVWYAHLWPRALDVNRPTAADVRAMALLAREQERIRAARVTLRLIPADSPPSDGDPPPSDGDSPPSDGDTSRAGGDSSPAGGGPPRSPGSDRPAGDRPPPGP
jgi:hypothetical protein